MEKNDTQCAHGLLFNGFSLVLVQTFVPNITQKITDNFANCSSCQVVDSFLDEQIFVKFDEDFVTRYDLPDFKVKIEFYDDKICTNFVEGVVKVQAAIYFRRAVSITYRFVVTNRRDDFCRSHLPINTDELILFSGIVQGIEHWEKDKGRYCINKDSYKVAISDINIPITESLDGTQKDFNKIQKAYKSLFLLDSDFADNACNDSHYTYIDVWEDISHSGCFSFDNLSEAEIITHIEEHHKSELIGLMSLYPYEWPYRSATDYHNICGYNVAIDTDDLVLTNENVSVVIGTYGSRGDESPTAWRDHLQSRYLYHTSWVEYFILVEVALIKKSVVNFVTTKYINNLGRVVKKNNKGKKLNVDIKDIIHDNALLNIRLTSIISRLGVSRYLRYMSHKYMYDKCCDNLSINEDMDQLNNIVDNCDLALNNANNIRELKESNQTNIVLGIISVASLLEIVLSDANVPLFKTLGCHRLADSSGQILISAVILLILWTTMKYIFEMFKKN